MTRQIDEQIKNLPDTPGVYVFLDDQGSVLYVGKATSLRSRVRSYFASNIAEARGPLIVDLLDYVHTIDHTQTDSVLEALILESQLIKKHQPKYNTKGKDNKSYQYVIITDESFPRIFPMRARELAKGEFDFKIKKQFGPFPHGKSVREALRIIRKIFPFRDKRATQSANERFYAQLGLTPDTSNAQAKRRYRNTIANIILFFEGKKKKLIKKLEKEMEAYVKKQAYEDAARVRDEIFALKHIQDVSLIKQERAFDDERRIEAYDVAHISGEHMVGVMTVVVDGEADTSSYRQFTIRDVEGVNDTKALQEVMQRRLGHPEWPMPSLIVADGGAAQRNAILAVLNKYGVQIPVVGVVKDEHHKPKQILGARKQIQRYEKSILLANSEAHRFAISFFRKKQRKNFTE